MLTSTIKFFFLLISSLYIYQKLLNRNSFSIKKRISIMIEIIPCAIIISSLKLHFPYLETLFIVGCIFLFGKYAIHTATKTAFCATIFSYGISYILFVVASLLTALLLTPFYYLQTPPRLLLFIPAGIIQYALAHLLFRLKRFQNGMPFLFQLKITNYGLLTGIFILICSILLEISDIFENSYFLFFISLILFSGINIIYWWYNRLNQNYLEKLRTAENTLHQKELEQKDLNISKIIESNDELAKIIHKDNKLIPAMEMAVHDFLTNYHCYTSDELQQKSTELVQYLQSMTHDRETILSKYQYAQQALPQTGIAPIDGLFSYMQKKANSLNISFQLSVLNNIKPMIEDIISTKDLSHLLSDLIENALIASQKTDNGKLLVRIGNLQNTYMLEVADNGELFSPEVYQNFGITSYTTHADTGGSGIGLMDIWQIKKKYCASLFIYEPIPEKSNYITYISILFDNKDRYIIRTYRQMDILSIQTRSDLLVFSDD